MLARERERRELEEKAREQEREAAEKEEKLMNEIMELKQRVARVRRMETLLCAQLSTKNGGLC